MHYTPVALFPSVKKVTVHLSWMSKPYFTLTEQRGVFWVIPWVVRILKADRYVSKKRLRRDHANMDFSGKA